MVIYSNEIIIVKKKLNASFFDRKINSFFCAPLLKGAEFDEVKDGDFLMVNIIKIIIFIKTRINQNFNKF